MYDFEASQRIVHDVDGSLDIQLDISNSRKNRRQKEEIDVIQEEIEESLEKSNIKPEIEVIFDDEATEPQSSDEEDVVLFISTSIAQYVTLSSHCAVSIVSSVTTVWQLTIIIAHGLEIVSGREIDFGSSGSFKHSSHSW